jgi:starch synthase
VLTEVLADPDQARAMGVAGRKRVEEHFAWASIAERTEALYRRLTA